MAVRSVLEDHETTVLELERVVSSIEDRISELEHKISRVSETKVVLEDIKVAGRLHDDLKRKVTNLDQWSDDLAQSFNIVEDRVAR